MQRTPGFNGTRLREAREARGIRATALAELLGVSRQSVSMYENGKQTPQPETLERIAIVLRMPREYFFSEPVIREATRAVFYRSMHAATKESRKRAEARYMWLKEAVGYITEFVELPRVNVPEVEIDDPAALSEDDIEAAAVRLRGAWGLGDGPISNMVLLLENHGVLVSRMLLHSDKLDAFSEWSANGRPYIVLGADKQAAVRSRFDAAHELAHLVLHRRLSDAALRRPETFRLMEQQAHRFAGAFLLPPRSFTREVDWPSIDAFFALKQRWGVAIATMIHRSEELGLVGRQAAQRMYISLSRRGWRTREPLDADLPVEEPRVLRRAFELVVREGVQSVDQVKRALPFPIEDLAEMLSLPLSFFGEPEPEVKLINMPARPRSSEVRVSGQSNTSAQVLRFPPPPQE